MMTEVKEDNQGNLFIEIEELLDELDWKIGDDLEWIDNDDGTFTLRKVNSED